MGKFRQDGSSAGQLTGFVRQYWQLLLVGVLFVVVQMPAFSEWWKIWMEKESYYSHGPIVPLIAGFMLWSRRNVLASIKLETCWFGALLLLITLPIHAVAILIGMRVLYMFSFFGILFGLVLLLGGWRIFKVMLVPLSFLITMIPIADTLIDSLTAKAQLISAAVAEQYFTLAGYEVHRYGNTIFSDSLPQPLLVGSPCSGLRLLISLITFCWFFIYIVDGKWWKKTFLMALTLPLAVFINSLRIALIGFVGFWWYSPDYMHSFHDYSGYIGLILCFAILFGIAKLIKMGDFVLGSRDNAEPDPSAVARVVSFSKPALALVIISLVFVGYVGNFIQPLYNLPKGDLHRANIPRAFGKWTSQELPIDDNTKTILSKGDLISLRYTNSESNKSVEVFLDAAMDVSAFHNPHLCLTGSGSPISNERQVKISFEQPKLDVKATVFNISRDYTSGMILHWYMFKDNSYPLTQDLMMVRGANMISDVKSILFHPFSLPELRKEVSQRQFTWYRLATDSCGDPKADYQFLESFAKELAANKKDFGK